MPLLGLLWIVVSFLLREVVIKFVILAAIFGALTVLGPLVTSYLAEGVSGTSLTNAFASLPSGLWYFMDWFRVGFGLPLVIAAFGTRFLIRRVPLIG